MVESGEGERVLCNEGKKNEAEYRHFVLGIVADTGLSSGKERMRRSKDDFSSQTGVGKGWQTGGAIFIHGGGGLREQYEMYL